jgi:poly-gamma-glutamate synthesis protein (capsule biosynthesis protein)
MRQLDKIYWLYKAQFPVRRATRGSGLEELFAAEAAKRWTLPEGFDPDVEVDLAAAGDLMDHPYLAHSRGSLYRRVAHELFDADVSMANLECVIAADRVDDFVIRPTDGAALLYRPAHFEAVQGHEGVCFSLLSTANNHSLDDGEAGVERTAEALRAAGIAYHGTNRTEADASTATLVERRGVRIAIIAHTFGVNGRPLPPDRPWLVNRAALNEPLHAIDFGAIEAQLRFCREARADFVVAQLHWGMEHEHYPRPAQLTVAHHLAELGVDLIVGHHPHVIQPVEHYRTARDRNRIVPIYYSLGNLVNPFSHPIFRRGAVARVRLAKGQLPDGTVRTYVRDATTVELEQTMDHERRRLELRPVAR